MPLETHDHTSTHLATFVPLATVKQSVTKLSVLWLYAVTADSCTIEIVSLAYCELLNATFQKFVFMYLTTVYTTEENKCTVGFIKLSCTSIRPPGLLQTLN
jgi:hypothetical protein